MEGFSGSQPIMVKVTWSETEVPLSNPQAMTWGLLADTVDPQGVITHWCAPWTSVTYIRQTLTPEESGVDADDPVITEPGRPGDVGKPENPGHKER